MWPGPVGFHQEALAGGLLVGNSLESKSVQVRVGGFGERTDFMSTFFLIQKLLL